MLDYKIILFDYWCGYDWITKNLCQYTNQTSTWICALVKMSNISFLPARKRVTRWLKSKKVWFFYFTRKDHKWSSLALPTLSCRLPAVDKSIPDVLLNIKLADEAMT